MAAQPFDVSRSSAIVLDVLVAQGHSVIVIFTEQRMRRFIFGVGGSLFTHAAILIALFFTFTRGGGGGGDEGRGGSGGGETDLDLSYPGSTPSPVAPGLTATASPMTAPTTMPEMKSPEKPEEKTDPNGDVVQQVVPPTKQAIASPLPPLPDAAGNSGTTGGGRAPGPKRIGFPGSGVDGSSVDGQRALLPAAVTCADPVAGRWEAFKYHTAGGGMNSWVKFKLVIGHNSDGSLSGTIISHTWSGAVTDLTPPPCEIGGFNIVVSMNASGRSEAGGKITFGASHYTVVAEECPSFGTSYAPDNFSGVIDPQRQEFQSLNNDGAVDINVPYVFRRVGCL